MTALGTALHDLEAAVHPSAVLAIRFLALTGFRRAELSGHMSKDRRGGREGLRWGDVDLDAGVITLRDSKTGRQVRVIGKAAVGLLKDARPQRAEADDPVCPGAVPGPPSIGIDRARRKLWEAAVLEGVDLHSLRHRFACTDAHVRDGRFAGHVSTSALLGLLSRSGVKVNIRGMGKQSSLQSAVAPSSGRSMEPNRWGQSVRVLRRPVEARAPRVEARVSSTAGSLGR